MKSCINVSFTVEEALNIVKSFGWGEIHDKVTKAIVAACENNDSRKFILTVYSIPEGKFVSSVKALKECMNWSLIDAKHWMDVVRGVAHDGPNGSTYYADSKPNMLTIDDELIANTLFKKWGELGVDVIKQRA